MTDVVINFDSTSKEYQIYESTSKTLIQSRTLGDGFGNLNAFLIQSGQIQKSILEDSEVRFHFDSHTFQEIIKSNLALMKRVSDIPSEFKNSASRFGVTPGSELGKKDKTSNFQRGKMSGFGSSNFGKSYKKFGSK